MNALVLLLAALAEPTNPASGAELRAESLYDEQHIGSWVLRSDAKARTFGVIWSNSGVVELSAASADGKARFIVRDNGARLNAWLSMPGCGMVPNDARYPGARKKPTLADFATEIVKGTGCPLGAYETEVSAWMRDFPAALEAMKSRAQSFYGIDVNRCEVPRPHGRKFRPQPPHPPCGFPPPEIGENHE